MPIYEYKCGKCDKEMEIVHGINEKPKKKCPKCGGRLTRLISLNSFHLKGTGWYKTDYAKSGESGKKPKKETGGENKSKEKKTSEKSNAAA